MWGGLRTGQRLITCHTSSFEKWWNHVDMFIHYKTGTLNGECKHANAFSFNWHAFYKKGYLVADAVNEVLRRTGYLPPEDGLEDFEEVKKDGKRSAT